MLFADGDGSSLDFFKKVEITDHIFEAWRVYTLKVNIISTRVNMGLTLLLLWIVFL